MPQPPELLAQELAQAEEAVDAYRRLAADDPGPHLPGLGTALDRYALLLGLSDRRADAVPIAEEAVDVLRALSARAPDPPTMSLTSALINLGNQLAGTGQHDEALLSLRAAVALSRRHGSGLQLASALEHLGIELGDTGRATEALEALTEAMELRRPLIETGTTEDAVDHWTGLVALIHQLHQMGRGDDARPYEELAAQYYRHVCETGPDYLAFVDDLLRERGYTVTETGFRSVSEGQPDRSERVAEAQPDPPDHGTEAQPDPPSRATEAQPDPPERVAEPRADERDVSEARADELNEEGLRLMREGRLEAAAARFREAIGAAQAIVPAEGEPTQRGPGDAVTASALHNLALVLSRLGKYGEAVEPLQRSADLHRIAARTDDRRRLQLASSLNNLGWTLLALQRFDDAVASLEEAIGLYRRDTGPPAALARSLYNHGVALGHLGRHDEALTSAEEAAEVLRPLYVHEPDAYREGFRDALTWVSRQLRHLGRAREARAAAREANRL
ncbi:tetratricopeptide repeat protein [Nonomuraea sp. PA05]|uniref:tetratricopeptide repeat protein n=1 Tax=Nonomuraea sp. PA05 TaxID=2604466 RepID=UPI0011DAD109|nr:tetratricopeptide repeat protein [Nonomuraea sp. PA05]TYB51113.1 tetratricopeptide repeat protein [Nonomuraea sp. PA05]